jgi:DNA-binding response OmpR family regulator
MSHPLRSLVAVSRDPERAELLDALADAGDYDVIFVESVAHGYSRIKQVMPDLVIVSAEIDDVAVCQLLSMLSIDNDLFGIPVVTCARQRAESTFEDVVGELIGDSSLPARALAMN